MKKNNPKTETATPHASAVPRERRGGRERAAKTENYAAGERAREAAYRAAYASEAAKKWIDALPPAVRAQAAREGLLKPQLPPPSFAREFREQASAASNWRGNQFDENDFAAAALDAAEINEINETESDENEI